MSKVMKFNIGWSKSVKTISWFVGLLFIGSIILLSHRLVNNGFDWIGFILIIVIFSVFIWTYISAPMYLYIQGDVLFIQKGLGKKEIIISEIEEIRNLSLMKGHNVRLFGSGGLFGYTGLFTNKQIGRYISYVGDNSQTFLIVMKNKKKYVLSSDDKQYVFSCIESKVKESKSRK